MPSAAVHNRSTTAVLDLHAGEWVEVRSFTEILATLDAQAELDALPFMPEMRQFCGRRFRVSKRAEKSCDVIKKTGGRRMLNAVHLENLRCDGSGHDGCQAGCLFFWKEAWLKRSPDQTTQPVPILSSLANDNNDVVTRATRAGQAPDTGETIYRCQITRMYDATQAMQWWDLRQYWRDWKYGNVTLWRMLRAFVIAIMNMTLRRIRRPTYPNAAGFVRGKTPAGSLNLQPGELVEVKTHKEILNTVNVHAKNRGLSFDPEMVRYCGGRYRVLRRVERIISEYNGRMMRMPNDCIILQGVTCVGDVSSRRLFCQRAIFPYWRELWLRRVESPTATATAPACTYECPEPAAAQHEAGVAR